MINGSYTILISAFLVGFFGSLHCIGMCGGITGLVGMGPDQENQNYDWKRFTVWMTVNAGRIFSYAVAGLIAGAIGEQVLAYFTPERAREFGMMFAGIFMIMLGLYITNWWRGLVYLEKLGGMIWYRLQPLAARYVLLTSYPALFLRGLIWGWLPCGLVYSSLALAVTSASSVTGMFVMMAFGIGTLPMLLAMGFAAEQLHKLRSMTIMRQFAGIVIIIFGVLTFTGLLHHSKGAGHQHEGHRPQEHQQHQ